MSVVEYTEQIQSKIVGQLSESESMNQKARCLARARRAWLQALIFRGHNNDAARRLHRSQLLHDQSAMSQDPKNAT